MNRKDRREVGKNERELISYHFKKHFRHGFTVHEDDELFQRAVFYLERDWCDSAEEAVRSAIARENNLKQQAQRRASHGRGYTRRYG